MEAATELGEVRPDRITRSRVTAHLDEHGVAYRRGEYGYAFFED